MAAPVPAHKADMAAVRRAVPAHLPVSAKMRLGFDSPDGALVCGTALAEGGAQQIVVHARTKADGYKPPAHWEWVARIRERVALPVIANGEVWTLDDYLRCRAMTGCDDVMIGRGASSGCRAHWRASWRPCSRHSASAEPSGRHLALRERLMSKPASISRVWILSTAPPVQP